MGRKININDISPGMRLVEDIHTDFGRFLVARGTTLEDQHLRIFKIWGITVVEVEDQNAAPEHPPELEITPEQQAYTDAYFCLQDKSLDAVQELRRICLQRIVRSNDPLPQQRQTAGSSAQGSAQEKTPSQNVDLRVWEAMEQCSPSKLLETNEVSLPSLPPVLMKLVEAVNDPRCSALEIAHLVEKDTALTASLLRIVNSPFYGFPSRIDTISRAVTIIGSRQLTTLAVGIVALRHFQGIPQDLVDMDAFWRHSLLVAYASRLLASTTNTPNSERFFVAGLLHDIGRLALYIIRPEASAACILASRQMSLPCHRLEPRLFGFDHADLGAAMMKKWNFPVTLEHCVGYHHNPLQSPAPKDAGMIHVADVLAWAIKPGPGLLSPLNIGSWNNLGISAVALSSIAEQSEFLFNQTARFFLSHE